MYTKVPFDADYVKLVGKAVYLFSYWEWIIVYIVERLQPGFLSEYSREHKRGMTSGQVRDRFERAVDGYAGDRGVEKRALECCWLVFADLIPKRNALIHAHPITDDDGAQILNYQSSPDAPISDMKWESASIEGFIQEVDTAASQAGEILQGLATE